MWNTCTSIVRSSRSVIISFRRNAICTTDAETPYPRIDNNRNAVWRWPAMCFTFKIRFGRLQYEERIHGGLGPVVGPLVFHQRVFRLAPSALSFRHDCELAANLAFDYCLHRRATRSIQWLLAQNHRRIGSNTTGFVESWTRSLAVHDYIVFYFQASVARIPPWYGKWQRLGIGSRISYTVGISVYTVFDEKLSA